MEKFIKQFSFIALENIFRELPNKITHSFNDINDIKPPKLMYPIFMVLMIGILACILTGFW
ncbi:hypothetical protein V9839_000245 [Campylobacter jejuni]|nr:hypothetical protein [Campylobacter jejuni]EHU1160021.1 hypothetical protein [Campylobacter jejuni]EIB5318300.1 hypothetical protein [Campylobacter jejuni]EJQ9078967.1 hypothetical protein [Campylobacter jejuni]EJW1444074.1 hypothetical protein [Campylobacter jejuni]